MSTQTTEISLTWQEANQNYLTAHLARLRSKLEFHAAQSLAVAGETSDEGEPIEWQGITQPPALDTLSTVFGLSPFERDVLLLCAGVELEATFSALCASAQLDPNQNYPTFGVALAALAEAHWSALSPDRPLRYWRLIELSRDGNLTQSRLRIDERILHYLVGIQHLDDRLRGYVEPIDPSISMANALTPSHQELAQKAVSRWQQGAQDSALPVIQLCGRESVKPIALQACAGWGLNLYSLRANNLPLDPSELQALLRLWEREAILGGNALLLICGDPVPGEKTREESIQYWVENSRTPLFLASRDRRASPNRWITTLEVDKPTLSEQKTLWSTALSKHADELDEVIDQLVAQFNLDAPSILGVCSQVMASNGQEHTEPALQKRLWDACRQQSRPQLENLTVPIKPIATWDDLVLPEMQSQILREIAVHVRHQLKVYENWGFAARSSRGLGISALFAGSSGTGKTMAAEVLANELRLDLYRIDLSQVVSKYIGETEKNLANVFDAAENGGAILLFDEADALFGKRSEVKDSHDRYANIEISYLLQRMEAYRGLAILTTNMRSALDSAFLRRIRFIVNFPFPDAKQRAEIWRRIFPPETPTNGLEPQKLARLNIAGGNIRNIALYGTFLAAEADEPVCMEHLLRAARVEYAKLDKPLTAAEIKDW